MRSRVHLLLLVICSAALLMVFSGAMFAQEASLLDDVTLSKEKEFTSLEEALKNPAKVYKLDLSHNGLAEFPIDILKLPNLQSLNLSNNGIEAIPGDIGKLPKLQRLNLATNGLKKLPAEIASLKHLKALDLSQNQFLTSELNRVKTSLPQVSVHD
ncbi:MAG: leucine-rich repeat domain-containing protein [Candidatus Kapabacteria bacterium]|nr:leucine-rich repeat domain-containing protein [Candidatus Kapabacteria bacterium]